MKNLLALVGAAVVLVVGLGWYLQWFKIGSEQSNAGKPKFSVEVESDKVKVDVNKGKETVVEFIKEHESGKGTPGQPTSLPLPGGSFTVPNQQLPPLPQLPPPPSGPAPGTNPTNIVIPPPPLPPVTGGN